MLNWVCLFQLNLTHEPTVLFVGWVRLICKLTKRKYNLILCIFSFQTLQIPLLRPYFCIIHWWRSVPRKITSENVKIKKYISYLLSLLFTSCGEWHTWMVSLKMQGALRDFVSTHTRIFAVLMSAISQVSWWLIQSSLCNSALI